MTTLFIGLLIFHGLLSRQQAVFVFFPLLVVGLRCRQITASLSSLHVRTIRPSRPSYQRHVLHKAAKDAALPARSQCGCSRCRVQCFSSHSADWQSAQTFVVYDGYHPSYCLYFACLVGICDAFPSYIRSILAVFLTFSLKKCTFHTKNALLSCIYRKKAVTLQP